MLYKEMCGELNRAISMYKKGDVVLVAFPFQDEHGHTQTRRRPAVIVSNDENNIRLDDVLLVPLTTHVMHERDDQFQVVVLMSSPEGKAAGLRLDSIIDCTVIATIPKTRLINKIGSFPPGTLKQIDDCIRRNIQPGGA